MSINLNLSKDLQLISEIFKSQSFLIQQDKEQFMFDKNRFITFFRTFKVQDLKFEKETDFRIFDAHLEKMGFIQYISKYASNKKSYELSLLLKDYINKKEQYSLEDGELKIFYDKISHLFDIHEQNVIANIRHFITFFHFEGKQYLLLSLLSDDFYVHRNGIIEL